MRRAGFSGFASLGLSAPGDAADRLYPTLAWCGGVVTQADRVPPCVGR
jgi:hypothetical protein